MKVLFVYPNITKQNGIQAGIASLSACLKKEGHETFLFDTTFIDLNKAPQLFAEKLKEINPKLIAFSVRSNEWPFVEKLLKKAKENHFVIIGGAHPTVAPKEVLENKTVNAIVLGEGEETFIELAEKLEKNQSIENIESLWVKKGKKIIKNKIRALNQKLDDLPLPDWELFDARHLTVYMDGKKVRLGVFETSRGCPFSCTYCINAFLQQTYRGCGKYHREKPIEKAVEEMAYFKKKYNLEYVYLIDETFLINVERLRKFKKLYKETVGLPFSFMTRPETVNEEKIKLVAEAGGKVVSIGIENGNEEFRKKVLNRHMTNWQIIESFRLSKKYGLITNSFNMVGLPFETREVIQDTIELNYNVKPHIVQTTIFFPFKGTKLYDLCIENNFLPKNYAALANYYEESVLNLPTISKKMVRRMAKLVPVYATTHKSLWPLIKLLENNDFLFESWLKFRKGKESLKLPFKALKIVKEEGFNGLMKRIKR